MSESLNLSSSPDVTPDDSPKNNQVSFVIEENMKPTPLSSARFTLMTPSVEDLHSNIKDF
jgi:hypothetical protein